MFLATTRLFKLRVEICALPMLRGKVHFQGSKRCRIGFPTAGCCRYIQIISNSTLFSMSFFFVSSQCDSYCSPDWVLFHFKYHSSFSKTFHQLILFNFLRISIYFFLSDVFPNFWCRKPECSSLFFSPIPLNVITIYQWKLLNATDNSARRAGIEKTSLFCGPHRCSQRRNRSTSSFRYIRTNCGWCGERQKRNTD